ncbi:MAG: hypothetical protein C5B51_22875 [Terriglobia bacterium]|nr:MAG: hypothetical protein C5B51_22875 [Terriglobia bacterium]
MDITLTALAGLSQAESAVESAAARLSRAGLSPDGSSGDTVDLATEIVDLMTAKQQFQANLKSLETANEMTKHTLDILA